MPFGGLTNPNTLIQTRSTSTQPLSTTPANSQDQSHERTGASRAVHGMIKLLNRWQYGDDLDLHPEHNEWVVESLTTDTFSSLGDLLVAHNQLVSSNCLVYEFLLSCQQWIKQNTAVDLRTSWKGKHGDTRIAFCVRLSKQTRWLFSDRWILQYAVVAFPSTHQTESMRESVRAFVQSTVSSKSHTLELC